jgi:hypothetical protein
MQHFSTLKRHLGFLALGLLLTLGIVAPQAVGASNAPPQGPTCIPCQQPQNPFVVPHFTKVHAWRAAGGMVDVQVEVENATSVQLLMPGTIALKSFDHYSTFDVYHFHVTGLTANQVYNYEVDASGYLVTSKYFGSVQA